MSDFRVKGEGLRRSYLGTLIALASPLICPCTQKQWLALSLLCMGSAWT